MSHSILSLDLGSTLGWALSFDGAIWASGEKSLKHNYSRLGEELETLTMFLNDFVTVNEIVYEKVSFVKGYHQIVNYGKYEGVLDRFNYLTGVKREKYAPGEWRQQLTGRWRASKKMGEEEKKRVCTHLHELGWKGGQKGTDFNNNEADAVGMLIAHLKKKGEYRGFKDSMPQKFDF